MGRVPDMEDTNTDDLIPIGEAARTLGVSVGTIRRWEREGKISARRTLAGHRRFSRDDLRRAKAG